MPDTLYDELLERTRHYMENPDLPFDMTPEPRKPERPQIDRYAIALMIQKRFDRPLTVEEYRLIWNKITEYLGRDDYLGPFEPVS